MLIILSSIDGKSAATAADAAGVWGFPTLSVCVSVLFIYLVSVSMSLREQICSQQELLCSHAEISVFCAESNSIAAEWRSGCVRLSAGRGDV